MYGFNEKNKVDKAIDLFQNAIADCVI